MKNLCRAHCCIVMAYNNGLCRYHHDHQPPDWPLISEKLNRNAALLKAIAWAMTEGQYQNNDKCCATLENLVSAYPDLQPKDNESGRVWAYRAIAWLDKECKPVKYGDMANRLRLSAAKTNLEPRNV